MVVAAIIVFFMVCIGIDAMLMMRRKREAAALGAASLFQGFFDEKTVVLPRGLKYDAGHTWTHMDEYGRIRIGIDDFLQHLVGPVSDIIMKNSGERVKKGEVFLSLIQNGKRLELRSPVTGSIKISNETLHRDATQLNHSPYEKGWIYLVEADDYKRDSRILFQSESAARWINAEFTRVKDFFASLSAATLPGMPVAVMQDGGILKDQVLKDFGPEIWEEFQTRFLESSGQLDTIPEK